MAANARTRVAENRWDNVDIVVGDAMTAPLPADLDAALFFLAISTPAPREPPRVLWRLWGALGSVESAGWIHAAVVG
jgi:hypothetical protein